MERTYRFESGTIVRVENGGYMAAEEIRNMEKAGDRLLDVKYGPTIVPVHYDVRIGIDCKKGGKCYERSTKSDN